MPVKKYRKKPVVVEAIRFTDGTMHQCFSFVTCNHHLSFDDNGNPVLVIQTLEGEMTTGLGDYIIKEPFPTSDRKFYPCKPDIFDQTYEEAEDE